MVTQIIEYYATDPSMGQQDLSETPFPLTDTDRQSLAGGDENYHCHTWDELKKIIADGNIGVMKRKPSDLLRYIKWSHETRAQYGNMTNFVCQKRLHWEPLPTSTKDTGPLFQCASEIPFASPQDYRILLNDWPYGISQNITHVIVWLKNRIPVQPPEGYLTEESKHLVGNFVQKAFVEKLKAIGQGDDQVLWFKNWVSLQSVPGLDHVHVLVRDAPKELLDEWTTGQAPLQLD